MLLALFAPTTVVMATHFTGQEAGQTPATSNEVSLVGGTLQRGLPSNAPVDESIIVNTGTETPRFIEHEFTVHAGKIIDIELRNHSKVGHKHDWALVRPGTRRKIEKEARAAGPNSDWIPNSPDILAFVRITNPGETGTALFRAPDKPGDYPFLCTYPGHGAIMHGILHVKASG